MRWDNPEARFSDLVRRTEGGCWEWAGGCTRDGYGRFTVNGLREAAHRVAWRFANGPIPDGMFICHRCDNKKCVRPDHLFVGTASDNMQDWTRKGKNRLANDRSLWQYGARNWNKTEAGRKQASENRKAEWASGRRVAIRDAKGRLMGTRMVAA